MDGNQWTLVMYVQLTSGHIFKGIEQDTLISSVVPLHIFLLQTYFSHCYSYHKPSYKSYHQCSILNTRVGENWFSTRSYSLAACYFGFLTLCPKAPLTRPVIELVPS